ncbi:hypothetical protein KNE206_14840 [Kitasatospora sp. NE20-6]
MPPERRHYRGVTSLFRQAPLRQLLKVLINKLTQRDLACCEAALAPPAVVADLRKRSPGTGAGTLPGERGAPG